MIPSYWLRLCWTNILHEQEETGFEILPFMVLLQLNKSRIH